MNYLAIALPMARRLRLPFSRDQAVLLLVAFNELMLGVETYIAHLVSGTIVPREWIPSFSGLRPGLSCLWPGFSRGANATRRRCWPAVSFWLA